MTKSSIKKTLWLSAAASAYALSASHALAEQAANGDPAADSEEIIVTALKQNTRLLETPASVTVLDSEAVTKGNITSAMQVESVVPGLVLGQGASNTGSPFIRGLGTNSPIFSIELSIPMYYDGVYYGRGQDLNAPIYDLASVQVISGTQSTMLGKNSSLGAISYTNNRPEKEAHFGINASHSFEIGQNQATGYLNLPLSDNVQARGAFFLSNEDGYYTNSFSGEPEVRGRDLSGRMSIAYQPSDALSLTLIYQHDDRKLDGQAFEVLKDPSGRLAARATSIGQIGFSGTVDDIVSIGSEAMGASTRGPSAFNYSNVDRLTGIADLQLGDHTLTAQTAYADTRIARNNDLDFTAGNLFNLQEDEKNRTVSQEIRLASPAGKPLSYLLGLYYFDNDFQMRRLISGSATSPAIFPLNGAADSLLVINTTTLSAFGSLSYEVSPQLKLTAGGRYTHETKDITFKRSGTGTFGTVAFPAVAPYAVKQTVDPFDYNLLVEFKPTNGIMLYGSYGKGSKSGGYQDAPTTALGGEYSPEAAYTTELGVKADFSRGTYVTAALYHTKVKSYQTAFTGEANGISQTLIGNTDIRSQGFEMTAGIKPSAGLSLTGSVVYADAEFTALPGGTAAIANPGDELIRAPKWNGSVAADYETPVNDNLTLFAGVDLRFSSSYLHQLVKMRPDAPVSGAYQVLGARAGLRSEAGWELSVIGTNLTNDRYINFATPVNFSTYPGQAAVGNQGYTGNRNRPRVIALQFKYAM
ncbi:TonB-dependent receptor [Novosphingobium sp.]|jgi:outer membrane receptor protein involved in Fe transport|uniref:TonB-dependent receptor n=1 Tax=Novosphingobium sp. TaxID=1874826 RepID=UPI0022BE97A6|nr:TonB-dependent receptor [Novosphingobium sp.]MCZ8018655.1 TonB-dependent receptor [Novosphingobium sp.]MCZ8034660.1 TonB-dependent receptor [Novosphingobium sp.]MCZ8052795.1 TonB-dependent receptor [Novosphingobium sp.]MCZ8060553.1 TonB-dependent receptor [Novosphingobium sp.]MCZ8230579.1 TonB-dependent receptor [Novosphingobium sp.]